ncbi:putative tRNA pseudouridine synthase C [Candidatus Erwinia dacicola]|uniref:tRNA pseudouridine synthase C n=1 Tax=Candidatus Erwinia dacicola TaxID=252393 RepID=A0A328TJX4_9GAMM|nr:putative tRNA pseudouridine synthase C [Candidatus Erwinia dacicola]
MNRLMLHASELRLNHPENGDPLLLRAGLDAVWQRAMTHCGWQNTLPQIPRGEFAAESPQDSEKIEF